jgi:hypothetical protein
MLQGSGFEKSRERDENGIRRPSSGQSFDQISTVMAGHFGQFLAYG